MSLNKTSSSRRRPKKLYRLVRRLIRPIGIVVGMLLLWHVASKIAEPYILDSREARETAQIKREIARLEAENRNLKSEIPYLKTEAGIEAEARKLGMVKEGEVALIIQNPTKEESGQETKKLAHPTLWQKIAGGIAGLLVSNGAGKHKN
ncbi:MAG: septum formation initiator family protein [Armatimonadota bacterium]|nr:septum formation initiator family protein [Armatimonadota bacterium]